MRLFTRPIKIGRQTKDVVTVGDMIWVKFMEIDEKGRWNLSRKDALIEIEAQQAAAKEQ